MPSPRALKRAEDSSKNLNKAFTPTMRTRSSDEGRPSEIAEEDEHSPPSDHPPSDPAEKEAGAGDGAAPLSPQSSTNSMRGRQISAKSSRSLRASMRSLFSSFRDNARFGTYEHVRGTKGGAFEGKCYVARDQDCCSCFARRDIHSLKIVLIKGTYCFVFPTLKDGTAKRDALCLEAIPLKGLETRVVGIKASMPVVPYDDQVDDEALRELFSELDTDNNGQIDFHELKLGLKRLGVSPRKLMKGDYDEEAAQRDVLRKA